MPPPEHFRLQFGGQLGSASQPVEQWSCSLSLNPGFQQTSSNDAGVMDDLQSDVTSFFTDTDLQMSNLVTLEYVKFNLINAAGHYANADSHTRIVDPVVRGTASGTWPFQNSLCVSLQASGRGPGRRGRMYLPPQGGIGSVGPDGTIPNGVQGNVCGAMKRFVDKLNDWPGLDVLASHVVVASSTGLHDVLSIRVGQVMDTQRRRRRSLEENYVTQNVG